MPVVVVMGSVMTRVGVQEPRDQERKLHLVVPFRRGGLGGSKRGRCLAAVAVAVFFRGENRRVYSGLRKRGEKKS
jgi:hypothetical protein